MNGSVCAVPFRAWAVFGVLASLAALFASSISASDEVPEPSPNSADEPFARELSFEKTGSFLDGAAQAWTREYRCGTCHTTYPYLMARAALGDENAPGLVNMRRFFEHRVANWDDPAEADRPPEGSEGVTEVVATAATLAFHDARSTRRLHPLTRAALDRMWTVQNPEGDWNWNKHELPPLEYDDYFGAVYAAMGVGFAPDDYVQEETAQAGLSKLRRYLRERRPPNLHHQAWLMFASIRLPGLMTPDERQTTISELLAKQQSDGGWNLPSLGNWDRLDGTPNDPDAESDGYATGLVTYFLRMAGVAQTDEPIQRAVSWLKTHQRESGRWFTRSLNADRDHYITNAGTAFAVLALEACGETPASPNVSAKSR